MDDLRKAVKILKKVGQLGYQAYIVGGAVRDSLLNAPIKDVDLATNCPIEVLEKEFETYVIGDSKKFGICVIKFQDSDFEIAQFRTDGKYTNNRHPESVEMANSIEEDLKRRDFTINAMALDSNLNVIDLVGGKDDLKNKILRTVGDPRERFSEDYLRMIRAARFASLGFKIEPKTRLAIRSLSRFCRNISVERLASEFEKASSSGSLEFAAFIKILSDLRILSKILPEVNCMKYFKHRNEHHPEGGVWDHTLEALKVSDPNFKVHMGVLLHDVGKTISMSEYPLRYKGHDKKSAILAKSILKKLKFPNNFIEETTFVCENHMKFFALPKMKRSKVLNLITSPYFPTLYQVAKADHLARESGLDCFKDIDLRISVELKKKPPVKVIDGNYIMEITGESSGPIIGKIKRLVTSKVIDENIPITEENLHKLVLKVWEELKC